MDAPFQAEAKLSPDNFCSVVELSWQYSGKTGKSRNLSGQGNSGKGQGKIFFGKVRENEKLVPPDVRFSG